MLCLAFSSGNTHCSVGVHLGWNAFRNGDVESFQRLQRAHCPSSFRIRAQSAGMLKPTVLLLSIRCSVTAESHLSFPAANAPEQLRYCALFTGQSARVWQVCVAGLCGADILVRESSVLQGICKPESPVFADKNVRATQTNHLPRDGSALVAASTSTCNLSDGSTPGG